MDYTDKINVLRENLRVLEDRCAISAEQRELVLREIARLICSQYVEAEPKDIRSAYLSSTDGIVGVEEIILYEEMLKVPTLSESIKHLIAIGSEDGTPAGTHGRIAYTKNKFNDLALQLFVETINNAKPLPVASNTDACESVISGKSEFCLLPIENTRDGKLFGFYSMLDRFELKICGVHTLDSDDDINSIKYALVAKSCKELGRRRLRTVEYIFEFSVVNPNGDFIESLLQVAKECGATLLSIDSRPIEYDPQLRKYIFCFLTDGNPVFRMYPALNYHGYSPIGLYHQ